MNVCLAQERFRFLGGTTTLLVDLASALLEMGAKVYFWSTDFGSDSVTEKWFLSHGIEPYYEGQLDFAVTCQQTATKFFRDKCPTVQILNSIFTNEEFPVSGCKGYASVSEEIQNFMYEKFHLMTPLVMNGIDLGRYKRREPLRTEKIRVLSICQGDDELLHKACAELGYYFTCVPKKVEERVWNIDELINEADLVVGIGRSAYSAMACGTPVISWDNRRLNPMTGCGYVTKDKWLDFRSTNLTGRGLPPIDTVEKMKAELLKYNPSDGEALREIAVSDLNSHVNCIKYMLIAGIDLQAP